MNLIELEGTYNTRDLGGYETIDGKTVKYGMLFRSDKLKNLTPLDCEKLSNLGIKRIIDFRSNEEKQREPNLIPEGMEYIEMPISVDNKIRGEIFDILNNKSDRDMRDFLIEANRDFILEFKEVFSQFVKILANSPKPTLFHCSAGKDRTGFAAFLIYSILGVDRDTIIVDYLKSNYFIKDSMEQQIENVSIILDITIEESRKLIPLLEVNIEYIESAIDTANSQYGSLDYFISEGLNISFKERDLLKELLLE